MTGAFFEHFQNCESCMATEQFVGIEQEVSGCRQRMMKLQSYIGNEIPKQQKKHRRIMGKSLADSHLVFWKTEKMHRNVSMILISEPGILSPRQDRSFSLRTLQRYAVFYVLMCWIIKMRKSEVLWQLSLRMKCSSAFQIHAMKIRCRGNRSDRI